MALSNEPSDTWKAWFLDYLQLGHVASIAPFPFVLSRNSTTDGGVRFTLPQSSYATHLSVAFHPAPGVYAVLILMDELEGAWTPAFSTELGYDGGVRLFESAETLAAEIVRVHSLCYECQEGV